MAPKVLVIGSGPSGIQAARRLLERGHKVELIDFGVASTRDWDGSYPKSEFARFRSESLVQSDLFWGEGFTEVPLRSRVGGSGMTPPRSFVTRETEKWIPTRSDGFAGVESLARGGLGEAWGLGAFTLSAAEIEAVGLPAAQIAESYRRVISRIGVSGTTAESGMLPPLNVDDAAQSLLDGHHRRAAWFEKKGLKLTKTPLALLSQDFQGRQACSYTDFDFYLNPGRSAYRPGFELEELAKNPAFTYSSGWLVLSVEESGRTASVHAISRKDQSTRLFSGDAVMLCAGTLGTARIVLRSRKSVKTPFGSSTDSLRMICSPYYQIIGVQLPLISRVLKEARHSMGQLVLEHSDASHPERVTLLSLLSYRSLLLTRLMREAPLPLRQSRRIFQLLQSGLTVGGLFFPQGIHDAHLTLSLESDPQSPSKDRLLIQSQNSPRQSATIAHERELVGLMQKGMRQLGAIPLRTVRMQTGSSIHYGGTLPFGTATDPASGRLDLYSRIFVGDGSPFKMVPGKGITLTLMAYADWVADRISETLRA